MEYILELDIINVNATKTELQNETIDECSE
jgi:hypothetical protein